ncbi:MAG: DUF7793 family protein [Bacteroidota bacterium]
MHISTQINNGHTVLLLREDGIIQVNATDHVYSIEDIKANTASIGELTNKQKTLVMVITSQYSDIEIDARQFISTPEAMKYSIAEAYVISSFAQRLIANFTLKIKGFSVPVKFFNETEPAVEWLKTFDHIPH